jgi:hypothetical protein
MRSFAKYRKRARHLRHCCLVVQHPRFPTSCSASASSCLPSRLSCHTVSSLLRKKEKQTWRRTSRAGPCQLSVSRRFTLYRRARPTGTALAIPQRSSRPLLYLKLDVNSSQAPAKSTSYSAAAARTCSSTITAVQEETRRSTYSAGGFRARRGGGIHVLVTYSYRHRHRH